MDNFFLFLKVKGIKDSLGGDLGSLSTMSGLSQLGGSSYYPNDSALSMDTDLTGTGTISYQTGPHSRPGAQAVQATKADYGMQKKTYIDFKCILFFKLCINTY